MRPYHRPRPVPGGKRIDGSARGDAFGQAEEPGGAEQPADRQPRPPRRDHRSDDREEHLAKHPDGIVGVNSAGPFSGGLASPSAR